MNLKHAMTVMLMLDRLEEENPHASLATPIIPQVVVIVVGA